MKTLLITLLGFACSAAELKPIKQVQPEYPDMGSAYIVDEAEVRMVVTGDGVPFSLESNIGLPDNVVRALAAWRYQPFGSANKGATISLAVPVRRPLSPALEAQLVIHWQISEETKKAVDRGRALDAGGAAALFARLAPAEERELG